MRRIYEDGDALHILRDDMGKEHPSETIVFHNEDGNPARANIKQALGYLKDGDGDGNSQPHKGVKASANSDVMYSFTSAQDGDPLQDDVRLCLGDDLKKAQDHSQRQAVSPKDSTQSSITILTLKTFGKTWKMDSGRLRKLINDMRNSKMDHVQDAALTQSFVRNMLPEWSRFILKSNLKSGLKESKLVISWSSSNRKLEESLSKTCPSHSIVQITSSQTNNQLRASSNARNKAMIQDGKVVVQDVRGRYSATNQGRTFNQGRPFQKNNARGNGVAGNVGAQNRGGMINPVPKRLQDSDYFKDKMLLMQAQESGAILDKEQSLFLAGEQVTNVDDDVDDSPENDLALNVDHVFEADECDAFDSDVDKGPTSHTMFMANLTSEDPIYDEAGPSYDSNNPFEVQDHDTFVDHMDEYHEVHEMQNDVQHNYVVDSDADYTSDSNIIPYDQYVEDNEEHVVQCKVSSVRNDALMSILDEMHE
ncbi:hypothetical protein Tco_0129466 [Tanacetum coccineum]